MKHKLFYYEHHSQPLLPRRQYLLRLGWHLLIAIFIITGSLLIGVIGYHITENLSWLDSLLNASMILGGMGPVNAIHTDAGKIFASFYALFSGMIFLATAGILIAPIAHRLLHKLHMDGENEVEEK
jgi:hypothetical protein